jgi:hypothetical protein
MKEHGKRFASLPLGEQERLHTKADTMYLQKCAERIENISHAEAAVLLFKLRLDAEQSQTGLKVQLGGKRLSDEDMCQMLEWMKARHDDTCQSNSGEIHPWQSPAVPTPEVIHVFESQKLRVAETKSISHWAHCICGNRADLSSIVVFESQADCAPAEPIGCLFLVRAISSRAAVTLR